MRTVFWVTIAIFALLMAGPTAALTAGQAGAAPKALDYEYFKTKVQPVFLEKRTGYTRCVVCHAWSSVTSNSEHRRSAQFVPAILSALVRARLP